MSSFRWFVLLGFCACGASVPAGSQTVERAAAATEIPSDIVAEGSFRAPMPKAVTSFGAAAVDGDIYVVGGYFGEVHGYSKEGQSAAVSRLTKGGKWQALEPMNVGLQGLAIAAYDGKVYRAGGMRAWNSVKEPAKLDSVADAAAFNSKSGRWETLPPLLKPRSSHAAAFVGSEFYVVGGWQLENGNENWLSNLEVLDVSEKRPVWKSIDVPFQRRGVAAVALGSELAVIGGMDENNDVSRLVEIYNPKSKQWRRGPDFPGEGFGAAAAGIGDVIYASGLDGVLYRWKAGEPEWKKAGSQVFARRFHQLVMLAPDVVAVLGGIGESAERTRVVEVIDTKKTQPDIARLTLSNPGKAKNRQGVFQQGETLYAFGGNSSLEQHDFEPERFLSEAHKLHLPSLTWQPMAPFPQARQTMQTVQFKDFGFALGGFGHDGTTARAHSDVYVYHFKEDAWSRRTRGLPSRRTQFGAGVYRERIWVFGGLDYDDTRDEKNHFIHLATLLDASATDARAPFERIGPDMPSPRRAFASAAVDNLYYIIGGMHDEFELVDGALVFDMKAQQWSEIPKPRRARLSARLVALGGKLYLIGGSSQNGKEIESDPSIEVYDPKTKKWQVLLENLPFETKHLYAMPYGDRIMLYSAHRDKPEVDLVFIRP